MNSGVAVVNNRIVGKPESCRLREGHERYMNGEVLSSSHCDVSDSTQIHDRFVWLFLNNNRTTLFAWLGVTCLIDSNNTESVFFAL